MEAITLQQIAPYLPYGLNFKITNPSEDRFGEIVILKGIYFTQTDRLTCQTDKGTFYAWELTPLLRNISSITKPIIHNGVEIDLLYYLEEKYFTYPISDWVKQLLEEPNWMSNMPYLLVEELIKHHFNVFGIPDHLFIDKSTVKI